MHKQERLRKNQLLSPSVRCYHGYMGRLSTHVHRLLATLLVVVVSYLLLCINPRPLFPHSMSRGEITIHSAHPVSEEMGEVLDRARQRLWRSAVYDRTAESHVFYCDSQWLFTLFARTNYAAGGIASLLGSNVFLRAGLLEDDRMIGFSGKPTAADRPFSYFLTHELMHVAHARLLGAFRYLLLPDWVDEGHADYVARDIDLEDALLGFKGGADELNPAKSGLYIRYHLMVAYLLEKADVEPAQLLRGPDIGENVQKRLRSLNDW